MASQVRAFSPLLLSVSLIVCYSNHELSESVLRPLHEPNWVHFKVYLNHQNI